MPCFYSNTAIRALRPFAHPAKWAQRGFLGFSPPLQTDKLQTTRLASTLLRPVDDSEKSVEISNTFTSAQTSRAARQSVILALKAPIGGVQDALHIVNSLHHPYLKQNPETAHLPHVIAFSGINFRQRINPRLASHALVHELVHRRQLQQAADLAVSMMQCGMRVRARTLDLVMRELQTSFKTKISKIMMPPNFNPNPSLDGLAAMAQHPSSRLAVQIFTVARKTGQGNTSGLFGTLLAICLVNTEIVLASLVFAMTVKEFYHPPPSPEGDTSSSTWNAEKYGPRSLVFLPTWSHFIDLTTPMKTFFHHVTTLTTHSPEFDQDALDANLQALAILANLLDGRQLHLPTISSLLTLMYNTPRIDSSVWVLDNFGNPINVVAYAYFHDVLVRLIESPPGNRGSFKKSTRAQMPCLGLKAGNTLLHYALRHLHSPALGNKVLVHLIQERRLTLDETTYNILLRSGTLLRDNDLASMAVTAMANHSRSRDKDRDQSKPRRRHKEKEKEPDLNTRTPHQVLARSQARHISSLIETLHSVELWALNRNRSAKLRTTLYTLTTHIMHLCSTGQPYLAKPIMFALFPVLGERFPTFETQVEARRKAVVRAAHYGPVTFTVLLNALVKARSFSEARLLYYFASAAERRSWFTPEPWTLGSEAYTIMLDLCAGECDDAAKLGRSAQTLAEKSQVKLMHARSLRMALRQYKKLKKLPYKASNTMRDHGHSKNIPKLVFPRLDERFATSLVNVLVRHFKYANPAFLAVPDVELRHRHPPRTQTKMSRESVSRTYDQAQRALAERGTLPEGWTQALQFIARGIVQAGMDVPPALRHLFIGRYDAATRTRGRGVSLKIVPWAYSSERPAESWHPWVAPSLRTRGMVTSWKRRRRRVSTTRNRLGIGRR